MAEGRTRPAGPADARRYLGKAEEFLEAAERELTAGLTVPATSLAIHAAINACDAVCAARLGRRAAGANHAEAVELVRQAGPEGAAVARDLSRLLPMKHRAEYEPEAVARGPATTAVERAGRCVDVARRVVANLR